MNNLELNELSKALVSGKMTMDEARGVLPPGCGIDETIEREPVWIPDQPAMHRERKCHRISGCVDPSDNRDWWCQAWSDPLPGA